MPSLAAYHPQIVHFAIAFLVIGVVFRAISLWGRFPFVAPAATALILLGTLASAAAVHSGVEAHGPVERVPGARAAVVEHETWGVRTRNVFVIVLVVDLVALALGARQHRFTRVASIASTIVGAVGLIVLYQAASQGGALVYSYAGGVGIRSGRPEDIERLLVAGVYHQASLDRASGRGSETLELVETTARRFPQNLELQLMAAEWAIEVRQDPAAALRRLDALQIPPTDTRARTRSGLLRARALEVSGNVAGARAVLETLRAEFPTNPQIQQRIAELSGTSGR